MPKKQKSPLGITPQSIMQITIIAASLVLAFFLFFNAGYGNSPTYSKTTEPKGTATAEFAECLTEKGAVLYGSNHCPHCNSQKIMFGKQIEKITFVNCDESQHLCEAAKITAYPTWVINGEKHLGAKSLGTLGSLTGCEVKG